jgi:hypothetical protein
MWLVSSLSPTEAWVRSQVSRCEIYGGQTGNEIGFFLRLLLSSPVSIITPLFPTYHLHVAATRRKWEPSKMQCFFGNREKLDTKNTWAIQ